MRLSLFFLAIKFVHFFRRISLIAFSFTCMQLEFVANGEK